MPSPRTGAARRATLVAVALYGLLVQAFLAGLAPAHAAVQQAPAGGIICEHEAAGGPVPEPGAHHQHDCCLAACMAAAIIAPAPPRAASLTWPVRQVRPVRWHLAPVQARAPPGASHVSARGPPAL